MASHGYDVSVIPLTKEGIVDLKEIERELDDKTIIVSICSVDSELGTVQPIKEISKLVKKYPNCVFHTDATQAIGKVEVDYTGVDFITFAPHKFFGLNGFGVLLNVSNKKMTPLIHGGKSTSIYRSGTPAAPLIVSISKALRLACMDQDKKIKHIKELNDYLKDNIKDMEGVFINSTDKSIPHILNMSIIGIKPETMLHALEAKDIYISTQSACSTGTISKAVMALTKDEARAASSIRVSISYVTTKEEIDEFIKSFKECYNELRLK